MDLLESYIIMLGIVVIIGVLFSKSPLPTALFLVIVGMMLSFVPYLPSIKIKPNIVLDVFLPLLIYQISSFASWKDMQKNLRPIILLSIGHVIFIAIIVAATAHLLIPHLSWPLAFVLGSVVSPPDDVAIVSVAEK